MKEIKKNSADVRMYVFSVTCYQISVLPATIWYFRRICLQLWMRRFIFCFNILKLLTEMETINHSAKPGFILSL
jgi:hypothetical protein